MNVKLYYLFVKHINNIGIRTKLLSFFLLITIVPFFVMTVINYSTVASETQNQTLYTANKMFQQNLTLLEYYVNSTLDITGTISLDTNTIQRVLKPKPDEYFSDFTIQNEDYINLKSYIERFEKYEYIDQLSLYVNGKYFFSDQDLTFCNLDKIKNEVWYDEALNSSDQLLWLPVSAIKGLLPNTTEISVLRKIRNIDYIPQIIGLIRIDIKQALITSIIEKSVITPHSIMFIINSNNEIICSTNDQSNFLENNRLSYSILDLQYPDIKAWYSTENNGNKYWFMNNTIPHTDWKVLLMIPASDLLSASDKSRNNMVVIAIFTSIFAYGLGYVFSRSLTKRITLLIKHMKKVEVGNFNIEILPQSSDEIGQLTKNFNYMITKISILLDEKLSIGKEMKNVELKALQAQINPHFLYNTLDLIHWRALNNNVPQISTLVKALARYYKLVLSRGEDTISLADEFEHVKIYIQIQNERFHNRINLITHLDDDLAEYLVPKLLLQPLVENSILHGIMQKTNNEGTISISVSSCPDKTVITVEDDGIGMTQAHCEAILSNQAKNNKTGSGYGVRNINDRIQLFYGKEYGVCFESSMGAGTKVIICLPPKERPF